MKYEKIFYLMMICTNTIFVYLINHLLSFDDISNIISILMLFGVTSTLLSIVLIYKTNIYLKEKLPKKIKFFIYLFWVFCPIAYAFFIFRSIFKNEIKLKSDFFITFVTLCLIFGSFLFQPKARYLAYNNVLSPSFSYVTETALSAKLALDLKNTFSTGGDSCGVDPDCCLKKISLIVDRDGYSRHMYALLLAVNADFIYKRFKNRVDKRNILINSNFSLMENLFNTYQYHWSGFSFSLLSPLATIEVLVLVSVDLIINMKFIEKILVTQEELIINESEKNNNNYFLINERKLSESKKKHRLKKIKKLMSIFEK